MLKPRTTEITLVAEGYPIFAEHGYKIRIDDVAAGEFIVVEDNAGNGRIAFDGEDWPAIRDAIDEMVASLRRNG